MSATPSKQQPISHSENYREKFHKVFPVLVKELTEDGLKNPEIDDGIRHLQDVSQSNIHPSGCYPSLVQFQLASVRH